MKARLHLLDEVHTVGYSEETIRIPLVVTILVLALIATPLAYWIYKINQSGSAATDTSKYNVLVEMVGTNVRTVDAMLRNDADALAAINAAAKKQTVTLIVPEVVIVEEKSTEPLKQGVLKAKLEGIYWSPNNPLAGINGETYRVGDKIQGYEIVRISKTAVQFQGEDGTIVVLDMYENLLKK